MKWNKKIINDLPGFKRYEIVNDDYTIDVNIGRQQGFPGSNQVNVYPRNYGGWAMGTPKSFKSVREVDSFIRQAKSKLIKKQHGKLVPFAR